MRNYFTENRLERETFSVKMQSVPVNWNPYSMLSSHHASAHMFGPAGIYAHPDQLAMRSGYAPTYRHPSGMVAPTQAPTVNKYGPESVYGAMSDPLAMQAGFPAATIKCEQPDSETNSDEPMNDSLVSTKFQSNINIMRLNC